MTKSATVSKIKPVDIAKQFDIVCKSLFTLRDDLDAEGMSKAAKATDNLWIKLDKMSRTYPDGKVFKVKVASDDVKLPKISKKAVKVYVSDLMDARWAKNDKAGAIKALAQIHNFTNHYECVVEEADGGWMLSKLY
jgi:maltodextrin utilization protein YvdJ